MKLRTMNKTDCIFVAGHKGLVGSAIVRKLIDQGYQNILTRDRNRLDLTNSLQVKEFFETHQVDYVLMLLLESVAFMIMMHTQQSLSIRTQ